MPHICYGKLGLKKNTQNTKAGKLFTWELCMWDNSTLFLQEFWHTLKHLMLYMGEFCILELLIWVLSYHSCTHLTKRDIHLHKPVKDLCFKVPDINCSKVQGAATYDYFYQTSYWWLNPALRQMPHKFKTQQYSVM
jgi:hypothetical protein